MSDTLEQNSNYFVISSSKQNAAIIMYHYKCTVDTLDDIISSIAWLESHFIKILNYTIKSNDNMIEFDFYSPSTHSTIAKLISIKNNVLQNFNYFDD